MVMKGESMKKTFILLSMILGLSASAFTQAEEVNSDEKIKMVSMSTSKTSGPIGSIEYYTYDDNGNHMLDLHVDASDDSISAYTAYKYEDNISFSVNYRDGEIKKATCSVINENGDCIEVLDYHRGDYTLQLFTYDENHLLQEELSYDGEESELLDKLTSGSRGQSYKYFYENGVLTKKVQYMLMFGKPMLDSEMANYDYIYENGLLVKIQENGDFGYWGNTEYEYDSDGNLIKESNDDKIYEYAYDSENRLAEKVDTEKERKYEYEYADYTAYEYPMEIPDYTIAEEGLEMLKSVLNKINEAI